MFDNRDQLLHVINMSSMTKEKIMKKKLKANIRHHI